MMKKFSKYYYKTKIIITLSLVSAALLLVMSRIGYYFVKDLYLEQLREKITMAARMLSNQIDVGYFSLLELGIPSSVANEYFNNIIKRNLSDDLHAQVSIFNRGYQSLIDTDPLQAKDYNNPELLLFINEITSLANDNSTTTTPFKGDDGNWYLYGFYRFDEDHFLGIKAHAKRFERIENFNTLFWIICLGGTLLIGIISWMLASSLTQSLYRLVDFSKKIGDNDFDVPPPENIKGEIKILTHALDTMRHNLAENHKERENILAQIAHEIRNPLGGIELLAELTKEDLQKNKLNTEYQDRILNEIYRLKSLITAYLNYSKPLPANPTDFDIKPILHEIEEIFRNKFEEKKIEFVVDVKNNIIRFDRDQLRQILLNLVSNSIDAIDHSGTIKVSMNRENDWLEISVSDNGKGLPEDIITKIFEPFFTTRDNGAGLGLAICRKFCTENHAEIFASNNPNGGSTFTFKKKDLS